MVSTRKCQKKAIVKQIDERYRGDLILQFSWNGTFGVYGWTPTEELSISYHWFLPPRLFNFPFIKVTWNDCWLTSRLSECEGNLECHVLQFIRCIKCLMTRIRLVGESDRNISRMSSRGDMKETLDSSFNARRCLPRATHDENFIYTAIMRSLCRCSSSFSCFSTHHHITSTLSLGNAVQALIKCLRYEFFFSHPKMNTTTKLI